MDSQTGLSSLYVYDSSGQVFLFVFSENFYEVRAVSAQTPKFKNTAEFLKYLQDNDIQFLDMNITDLRGKWHHTSEHVSAIDEYKLERGVFFDGASLAGWRPFNDSDMILKADLSRVMLDPFAAQKTLKVFCDVLDAKTGKIYNRDPRAVAKAAEKHLRSSDIADMAYFGPELEFFIFDDVKINVEMNHVGFKVDTEEGSYNAGRNYPTGNMGHRPALGGGYFPEAPVDSLSDIRGEMLTVLNGMGVAVEKHHHEVAAGQCELGIVHSTLTESADNVQLYKHAVHNVAHSYGKTATFMPKPLCGDSGSGLHVHQSLWKGGKPLFAGNAYADLSETALYYIGGIIRHARALNAFTNPTTNSYKRLIPGFEAPVFLTYSARNRLAACRIPTSASPKGRRVEIRFPDPAANPYLAFAALTMAGLDGIENKIHPGEATDKNIHDLTRDEFGRIPTLCRSLRGAIRALREDHAFLLKGGVFSEDLIEAYLALKEEENEAYESMVHPIEYKMYYSV
ncbi:MAG: type I glutamate--ammonia ligase [Alphaproteobacteria bacterium]|nr:type I glutamate--ammonia ligase [Alphaproteobacteria bacterium]